MFGVQRPDIVKSKAYELPKLLGRHVAPLGMTRQGRPSFLWEHVNDLVVDWLRAAMFPGIYFHRSISILGNEPSINAQVVSSSGV